jgi:hypothetical protein
MSDSEEETEIEEVAVDLEGETEIEEGAADSEVGTDVIDISDFNNAPLIHFN